MLSPNFHQSRDTTLEEDPPLDHDDPEKPEFARWNSYTKFAQSVRHERRHIFPPEVTAFLDTVRATARKREAILKKGTLLYRAQHGTAWHIIKDENGVETGREIVGYDRTRMKPRPNKSPQGRANPLGIPVLYLGTTIRNVISEVRPWVGTEVSVAQFKIQRDLKGIDLLKGTGMPSWLDFTWAQISDENTLDAETKEKAVWNEIDNAFSTPLTLSDDSADYVPTQILAEFLRDAGYDAIVYKSNFGEDGVNVALFNPEDAEAVNCAPYAVKSIEVSFDMIGNRWFRSKPPSHIKDSIKKL